MAGVDHAQLAWRNLVDASTQRYKAAGRFGYHFARGKLLRDPAFAYIVSQGLLHVQGRGDHAAAPLRLLDIGSGQSLLASVLHHMTPSPVFSYTGIELMQNDVDRARAALLDVPHPVRVICADMTQVALPDSDVVVILDVLHYVGIEAQDALLARVHACLSDHGRLLLRVGDQSSKRGFAASQWVDRVVTAIRGHTVPPTFGRPLDDWLRSLKKLGFAVRAVPKSEGTPFANVLLIAQKAAPERAT
jgi:2-polyprenyl-3-methyl-5-hydroxy-6-metoxy-1,4-benzoquinol methylase